MLLNADTLDKLFTGLGSKVALAVSGGVDSMALLHLFSAWAQSKDKRVAAIVVTVDHGLRPEFAAEAEAVAREAAALGLPHVTAAWTGSKPTSGLQAAARAARYRLIEDVMSRNACDTLLTAHTRDDQAETVWMRLKRGTGIDGLAGMRRARRLPNGATHLRPLLDVGKADLVAFMRAHNHTWLEDPSNASAAFERVRVRGQQPEFNALGLTRENLARTARRADQMVRYLDAAIARKIAAANGQMQYDPLGYVTITHAWYETLEPLEQTRLLAALLDAVGGQSEPLPLGQFEDIVEKMTDASGRVRLAAAPKNLHGFTLHGAQVEIGADTFRVVREALDARAPLSDLPTHLAAAPLAPGETIVWDNRVVVTLKKSAPHGVTVGPLTERGLAELESAGWVRPDAPARVLWTLPALRHSGRIVAVAERITPDSTLRPGDVVVGTYRQPFRDT